jgi:hypothetical protein
LRFDNTKLVLLQGADAHVFYFINKKLLHSLKIEQQLQEIGSSVLK